MDEANRVCGTAMDGAVRVELCGGAVVAVALSPGWRRSVEYYDVQDGLAAALNDALDRRARMVAQLLPVGPVGLAGDDLRLRVQGLEVGS